MSFNYLFIAIRGTLCTVFCVSLDYTSSYVMRITTEFFRLHKLHKECNTFLAAVTMQFAALVRQLLHHLCGAGRETLYWQATHAAVL